MLLGRKYSIAEVDPFGEPPPPWAPNMSNGAAGSASSYSLRVTAADVASAATNPDARALEWVRVAARAFPLLGTVSKAKRARKSGELTLNGSALVPTNVAAAVGDEIVYASRAAVSSAMYATGDQSSRIEEKEDRRGSGQCEDEEVDRDGEKDEDDAEIRRWAAVCERQGLRRVFENNEMALVVKPGASRRRYASGSSCTTLTIR